jgi:hypothetical protein
MRFIDFLVHQYGYVNRSSLTDYYGISTPQASADIKGYMAMAPGNIYYDGNNKAYQRATTFVRVFE